MQKYKSHTHGGTVSTIQELLFEPHLVAVQGEVGIGRDLSIDHGKKTILKDGVGQGGGTKGGRVRQCPDGEGVLPLAVNQLVDRIPHKDQGILIAIGNDLHYEMIQWGGPSPTSLDGFPLDLHHGLLPQWHKRALVYLFK